MLHEQCNKNMQTYSNAMLAEAVHEQAACTLVVFMMLCCVALCKFRHEEHASESLALADDKISCNELICQ